MLDINPNREEQSISGSKNSNYQDEPKIIGLGKGSKINFTTLFSLLSLMIFIAMAVFLFIFNLGKQAQLETKDEAFLRLDQELKTKDLADFSKKAVQIEKGLKEVDKFLVQRPLYNGFISELKKITPSEIKYINLAVDEKSNAKISGKTDNFDNVAKLLALLQNSAKLTQTELTSITTATSKDESDLVNFSITAQLVSKELLASENSKQTSASSAKVVDGKEDK